MLKLKRFISAILKNEIIWLAIILLAGFAVRLYKINSPIADWHSWRQADTASVSKIYIERGINILYPRYHDVSSIQSGRFNPKGYRFVEFPVYNAVHALLARSFPIYSIEVWGRLVSIFSSLVSALIIFLLGRKYISKSGGILAALFFLFIPYNIFFSRVILPEPMATMLALLALWLFTVYLDKEQSLILFLSSLVLALAILIKPPAVFFGVPMVYLILNKYGRQVYRNSKLFIKLLVFFAVCVLPFLFWRGWLNQFPAGIPFFEWAFNGDAIRFRPAFWRWLFAERLGDLILGIWGLPLFVLGLIWTKGKNYFIQFFLLGIFFYVSIFATANVRHDYYQIFVIPAAALALANGAVFLINSTVFIKFLSRLILIFSVLMMLGVGVYQVKEFYKINHPEIIAAGKAVDRLTPKDAWVIAPYNGDTAFLYQTGRWGWPAVDDSFGNLIKEGADYYVSVNSGDQDTQMLLKKYAVLEKTPTYVIIDLHKPLKPN